MSNLRPPIRAATTCPAGGPGMKQASEGCLKTFCLPLPGSRVRIRANAGCAATQGSTQQGTMRVCGRAVPSPRLAIANKAQLVFRKSRLLGVGTEWPPQSLAQDGKPGPVSTPRAEPAPHLWLNPQSTPDQAINTPLRQSRADIHSTQLQTHRSRFDKNSSSNTNTPKLLRLLHVSMCVHLACTHLQSWTLVATPRQPTGLKPLSLIHTPGERSSRFRGVTNIMKQAAGAGAPSIASLHLAARSAFGWACSEPCWRWLIMPKGPTTVLLSNMSSIPTF